MYTSNLYHFILNFLAKNFFYCFFFMKANNL